MGLDGIAFLIATVPSMRLQFRAPSRVTGATVLHPTGSCRTRALLRRNDPLRNTPRPVTKYADLFSWRFSGVFSEELRAG